MAKKWIDMTEDERVQHRIETNREIDRNVEEKAHHLRIKAQVKHDRTIGRLVREFHDTLPDVEKPYFCDLLKQLGMLK